MSCTKTLVLYHFYIQYANVLCQVKRLCVRVCVLLWINQLVRTRRGTNETSYEWKIEATANNAHMKVQSFAIS